MTAPKNATRSSDDVVRLVKRTIDKTPPPSPQQIDAVSRIVRRAA